jgi:hypothetical protein
MQPLKKLAATPRSTGTYHQSQVMHEIPAMVLKKIAQADIVAGMMNIFFYI